MEPIRLIDLGEVPYLRSQSIYHCIAETMTPNTQDTIVLLVPRDPYLCVGYHQDLEARLDLGACRAHNLPIVRRKLGGGAVYLDRDQLFYQCIFRRDRAPVQVDALFQRFLSGPVAALRDLGLDCYLRPPNEIEVRGKRIAGTGAGQIREASVVVGNVIFDFPHELMAALWRTPSDNYRDLARAELERQVTTLTKEMKGRPSLQTVKDALIKGYSETLGREIETGDLSDCELERLDVVDRRLSAEDWLTREGSLKGDALKISARSSIRETSCHLNGSTHRVTAVISNGTIGRVQLQPPIQAVETALRGWRPREGVSAAILDSSPHLHAEHDLLETLKRWCEAGVH